MEQITSTDLQRKLGEVMSKAKREPITITSRGREELIICNVEEFKRLQLLAERKAHYAHELGEEWGERLEQSYQGNDTPELDHLLD